MAFGNFAGSIHRWSFESLQEKRQRELAQFQQGVAQARPLVQQGDYQGAAAAVASVVPSKGPTYEEQFEKWLKDPDPDARMPSRLDSRPKAKAPEENYSLDFNRSPFDADTQRQIGLTPSGPHSAPASRGGGSFLGDIGDIASGIGSRLKDVPGDIAGGDWRALGEDIGGSAAQALSAPTRLITQPAAGNFIRAGRDVYGGIRDRDLSQVGSGLLRGATAGVASPLIGASSIANDLGAGLPDLYGQGQQEWGDFQANENIPIGLRIGAQAGIDPLTYLGPGALKGVLPAAARGLLESPLRAGVGAALGAGAGAQGAEMLGQNVGVGALLGGLAGGIGPGLAQGAHRGAQTQGGWKTALGSEEGSIRLPGGGGGEDVSGLGSRLLPVAADKAAGNGGASKGTSRLKPLSRETPYTKLPAVKQVDEIGALVDSGQSVFVRWSRGPEFDVQSSGSRNGVTGKMESGHSAIQLERYGGEQSLAGFLTALAEYSHFQIFADSRARPWLVTGDVIGRGSDGESLLGNWRPIAKVSPALIKQAEEFTRQFSRWRDAVDQSYRTKAKTWSPVNSYGPEAIARFVEANDLGVPIPPLVADLLRLGDQSSVISSAGRSTQQGQVTDFTPEEVRLPNGRLATPEEIALMREFNALSEPEVPPWRTEGSVAESTYTPDLIAELRDRDVPPPTPPDNLHPASFPGDNEPNPYVEADILNLPELRPIPLSRTDRVMNALKGSLGMVQEDTVATPAMRARKQLAFAVDSQAKRLALKAEALVGQVFKRDRQGRILDFGDIKPTIQDVAARLPDYLPMLDDAQRTAMEALRAEVAPYRALLEKVGIDIASRADVQEGGFYLPRGRADIEGADAPLKVSAGARRGTKASFEKGATFESMMQGIDEGYEYTSLTEALYSYGTQAGRRSVDQHVADYFKNVTDEGGVLIGETALDRLPAEVRREYMDAKALALKLSGRLRTAERRAGIAKSRAYDLATMLEKQATGATISPATKKASLSEMRERMRGLREGAPIARSAEGATNELNTINNFLTRARGRIVELRTRGSWSDTEALNYREMLDDADARLANVEPIYRKALEDARATPRDQGSIGFAQLSGMSFPDAVANAANKYLQAEMPSTGKGSALLKTVEALNSLLRGLRASADASFMGIQGLIGAARDPLGYGRANAVAWKSLADPVALGKYIVDFDAKATAAGMPTSREWATNGLHIGGLDTEFSIGAGLPDKFSGLVKGAPVFKQSNRAFGYFGDVLRMELAQNAYKNAKSAGFDMTDVKNLGEAANSANLATGWSRNVFAGDLGQLAQFAPRFFKSQLEFLGSVLKPHGIQGREARRGLAQMLGIGAGLTALANEVSDEKIPLEELYDPRSPNFMRFRFKGQDISLFGPWDSLLRGISHTVQGDPSYMLRTKASPAVQLAWDYLSSEDFMGDPTRIGESKLPNPGWLLTNLLPFSLQGVAEDAPLKTLAGATGLKATPMTPTEDLDVVARAQYGKTFYDLSPSEQKGIKDEHPDLWQRAVEKGTDRRVRYEEVKKEILAEQEADDELFKQGKLTQAKWKAAAGDRSTELNAKREEIYQGHEFTGKKDLVLEGYFSAIDASKVNGRPDWDAVDAYMDGLSDADRDYIEKNTGLNKTPLQKRYKEAAAAYYAIPQYRGMTADQGQAMNAARDLVKQNARSGQQLDMLRALRQIGDRIDPETARYVKRAILGIVQEGTARKRWARQNTEGAYLLGLTGGSAEGLRAG